MGKPKIDSTKIPKVDQMLLGATFLDAVERFYSDPANEERFQEWKRKRQTKEEYPPPVLPTPRTGKAEQNTSPVSASDSTKRK